MLAACLSTQESGLRRVIVVTLRRTGARDPDSLCDAISSHEMRGAGMNLGAGRVGPESSIHLSHPLAL